MPVNIIDIVQFVYCLGSLLAHSAVWAVSPSRNETEVKIQTSQWKKSFVLVPNKLCMTCLLPALVDRGSFRKTSEMARVESFYCQM